MKWNGEPSADGAGGDDRGTRPSSSRDLRVGLGPLAQRILGGDPDDARPPDSGAAERLLRRYLGAAEDRPPGWAYPDFLPADRSRPPSQVPLEIDDDLWRALVREAMKQGVEVDRLFEHAILFAAAELDGQGRDPAAGGDRAPAERRIRSVPPEGA